jgi:histidinol phosphatase-like enzyme (inositol monophosphatase family)
MTSSLTSLLDFALDAAWRAGRTALAHYQTGVTVERKPDQSAVTVADREGERLLRRLIEARYPDHAILGEEFGGDEKDGVYRWIIDPIDGTNSFVRGVPLFGVLLGLAIRGEPVVGVAHFPALGDMIGAARGEGCRWNGRLARVSSVSNLQQACLVCTEARAVQGRLGQGWDRLMEAVGLTRGWGDCYGHCLVATGRVDAMLDPRMQPWDCAALVPIVQEAGGRFTDWRGRVVIDGGDALSSNGVLHDTILGMLDPVS